MRDGEAIQLANSKIDEIRGAFPEWLREQSSDFKDQMSIRDRISTYPDIQISSISVLPFHSILSLFVVRSSDTPRCV